MTDITDLDGLETHDCFTITEYMAIDHCGLTAPGESWKAVEEGRITRDGDFPINPSGGLIGLGHPVGARVSAWCSIARDRSPVRLVIIRLPMPRT
jgi:acetyl-CoA C-acetyltransferase